MANDLELSPDELENDPIKCIECGVPSDSETHCTTNNCGQFDYVARLKGKCYYCGTDISGDYGGDHVLSNDELRYTLCKADCDN